MDASTFKYLLDRLKADPLSSQQRSILARLCRNGDASPEEDLTLLRRKEVMDLLGCSSTHLQHLEARGDLIPLRTAPRAGWVRFRKSDVVKYLEELTTA